MRLYRVTSFTGLDGLKRLEEPDPAAPVAGQVQVRVCATSINFGDLLDLSGGLQGTEGGMAPNHIPMADGAGEVVAVGPLVTRVKVGDRVAMTFHPTWIDGPIPDDFCVLGRASGPCEGCLAEFKVVDQSELVIVPDHLSFEEAATLPCAGVTAWAALRGQVGKLEAGEDVLVMGSGGVSVFALQFAKIAGARVIATTSSPAKMDRLRELGADVVVDTSGGAGWHEAVLKATGSRGVDVALDVGGASSWRETMLSTRRCGRVSLVGMLSMQEGDMPVVFSMRGINLNPTRVGSRRHFEDMNRAISQAKMRPVIDSVFGFDQVRAAFEHFSTGTRMGKVVIRID